MSPRSGKIKERAKERIKGEKQEEKRGTEMDFKINLNKRLDKTGSKERRYKYLNAANVSTFTKNLHSSEKS